jgi:ABC-type multidrug transport system fused ATPase/permease subunit
MTGIIDHSNALHGGTAREAGLRLMASCARRRPVLGGLGVIAAALATILQLCVPWEFKRLFDIVDSGAQSELAAAVMLVAAAAVGATLFDALRTAVFGALADSVLAHVRCELHRNMLGYPLTEFQRDQTGRVMSLFTSDAPAMARLIQPVFSEGIYGVFQLIGVFAILWSLYGWVVVLVPVASALYMVVPAITGPRLRLLNRRLQETTANVSAALQESIASVREIKAFNREQWDGERIAERFRAMLPVQVRLAITQLATSSNIVLYWVVAGAIYWIGGRQVIAAGVSVGSLYALVWYFTFVDVPVRRLMSLNSPYQAAAASTERVMAAMVRCDRRETPTPGVPPRLLHGSITFEHVSFGYDVARRVLDDVSFTIEAAQRVALVGPSGAGKSTVLGLILGLYAPTRGRILIDGVDLARLGSAAVREHIGVVFQDTVLFDATIRENIRFGRLSASDSEVESAARAASADEFITQLTSGYDTVVGERGVALSGGQRQRIALARAMLRCPTILLLDEPTTALDAETATAVTTTLETAMAGRTTVLVTHDLASAANADNILFLNRGRLSEEGSHAQLLTRAGEYQHAYRVLRADSAAP